ncbi:hypothetical protein BDQ17DRAFT_779816 [Cyathus striatus]|nr:hypothetical protein BDQ17DRAFT_779816 [Cyathus striatus]
MKSLLMDKSLPVQRGACEVLINLYKPPTFPALPEIDSLISNSLCSLEQADQLTRSAHANLIGYILTSTQIECVIPISESSSGKRKRGEEGEEGTAQVQDVTKPLCTPQEMLLHLSNLYNRTLMTKVRVGIFNFYAALFTHLGPSFIELNYALILSHLLNEIVNSPRSLTSTYDILLTCTFVSILLRKLIGERMLSGQGQISAIKEMANSYLGKWPALMPGRGGVHKGVLVLLLGEVGALVKRLGDASSVVQENLTDPLITLLSHPSHSVRIHTAYALRQFCNNTPTLLPRLILTIQEKLHRDLSAILNPSSPTDISRRALGHAYGLASLVSYDISATVLDLASTLLKKAAESNMRVASVQSEIALVLLSSLMSLVPNFVRGHLTQFLVLWRNALPKMTEERELTSVPRAEVEFLLLLRGYVVGSMLAFLKWNKGLVSLDVERRVASVLSNALSFADAVVSLPAEDPDLSQPKKGLGMKEQEALLHKRVFLCFLLLGFAGVEESAQGAPLKSCIGLFASPDGYTGSSVQAAITSSSEAFKDLWASADGYACGITSICVEGEGGGGRGGER